MNKGFIIKKLALEGPGLKPAIIEFKQGLNVISGPTNTGKTFVFECIDYMLGGKKLERIVTHAQEYKKGYLEVQSNDKIFTLERAIKGGDFRVYNGRYGSNLLKVENKIYSSKHNKGDEDTISAFLLKLNNLWGKEIRINEKGAKRTLSYRDICHLLFVSETEIIKHTSPILSSNYTAKTAEINTVKYLVTGSDDSAIITRPDKKTINFKKGKIELLDELIKKISGSGLKNKNQDASVEINSIDERINSAKISYGYLLNEFSKYDNDRKHLSKEIHDANEKLVSIQETLVRSQLLKEHYNTDTKRLRATIEAGLLLSKNEKNLETCPYCTSIISTATSSEEIAETINSCEKEISKIELLFKELDVSKNEIEKEKLSIQTLIETRNASLKEVETILTEQINTKLKSHLELIDSLNKERSKLLKSIFQEENISEYTRYKDEIKAAIKTPKEKVIFDTLTTSLMQKVCDKVLQIFKDCKYSPTNSVSFSENELDLVINSEDRKLSGKGFRAIAHAIFKIALTEYMKEKTYSISIPMFDSPLVTYSKPESNNEHISQDLAMNFYRYCANKTKCDQIIILENEKPPSDININHIVFTGLDDKGRKGFIPPKAKALQLFDGNT